MARDQISATSAALNSLHSKAFVTLHSRLDRGGALQARKLANPDLAGQRVRSAEIVVELIDREAVAVVRTSYSVLAFDAASRLDLGRLFAQQQARVETVLAPVLASPGRDANLIEANARFIAQGGTWSPSKSLARAIDDAALGLRKCPRLRIDNS